MNKYYFLFFLIIPFPLASQSVYIIIHGTWGVATSWYAPGGDFFDAFVENSAKKNAIAVVPFSWSGKNRHEARVQAAQNLVRLIQTYHTDTKIYLIGHSHGGNVATFASQLLHNDAKNRHRIEVIYNFGTPICNQYAPAMEVINYLYNLFSFEDLIQPVLGIFRREYSSHERIANVRVFIDGKEPGHTDLHSPIIASHLPLFHDWFVHEALGFSHPSIIYFSRNSPPQYLIDNQREEMIERDQRASALILFSFSRV